MGDQIFVEMPDLVVEEFVQTDSNFHCSECHFCNEEVETCKLLACEPSERKDGRRVIFKLKEASNG